MQPTFDYIAPYYDALATIVYGKKLSGAKKEFIPLLPHQGRLLLMGGGTGNILNYILTIHDHLTIDYVEASASMVTIAKKKLYTSFSSRVTFIVGNHHSIPQDITYDAASAFFVIDCMQQGTATEFMHAITLSLKSKGLFLFSDFFYTNNIFQRSLLWFMYRFFRVTTGIAAEELPDYDMLFRELKEVERKKFLRGFIQSRVYVKE